MPRSEVETARWASKRRVPTQHQRSGLPRRSDV